MMKRRHEDTGKRRKLQCHRFVTSPIRYKKGFTLVEMLVTLAIIGLMGGVAGTVYYKNYRAEAGEELTLEIMDTIKKAILGTDIPHNRGVQISGYVADMGTLPPLNGDNQPESLWKQTPGLKDSRYYEEERIRAGWDGPYIQEPDSGCLTDGWGNGLAFVYNEGDGSLTITSYGADMKPGGTDLKSDITLKIKKCHYMAPVALRLKGLKDDIQHSKLEINYPDPKDGALKSDKLELDKFGGFMSGEGMVFPIGLRSISAIIRRRGEEENKVIVFSIQPGINYLGALE